MNTKLIINHGLIFAVFLSLFFQAFLILGQTASRIRIQANTSMVCKKSKPSDSEMTGALSQAKLEILKTYLDKSDSARRLVLEPMRANLESSIDSVVSDVQVVAQDFDASSKTLSLSVVGFINDGVITSMIPRVTGAKNYISLVFVARRQTAVKSLGPEVIAGTSKIDSNTKQNSQKSSGADNTASITLKTDSAVISKSAVIKSSDKISYDVTASDTLDTAIEGVLAERNFKVVPAATIRKKSNGAFAVEKFLESFKTGSDVDADLIQNAAEACVKMTPKLPFYGFGTLTLEPPQQDAVSGRIRVNVQVYAKIIDCRDDFATTAASIEAIQYSGLGESATEAETIALTGAAKLGARMIADKLNAKGIY